jgi:hypothetical protein
LEARLLSRGSRDEKTRRIKKRDVSSKKKLQKRKQFFFELVVLNDPGVQVIHAGESEAAVGTTGRRPSACTI